MKLTVWLATRDRHTWIMAVEIVALGLVVGTASTTPWRLVGLALLAHLGYTALTSLPVGSIPGRPENARRERRNQELRSKVVAFLNEVRRVEDFHRRARTGGIPEEEVQENLRSAERRVMAAAAQVAKTTCRPPPPQISVTRGLRPPDEKPEPTAAA